MISRRRCANADADESMDDDSFDDDFPSRLSLSVSLSVIFLKGPINSRSFPPLF